jgi:pimeloyl-ACP methyl ester carboxylesterase
MPEFKSDGTEIHYEVEGEGPELIMIHGFAASLQDNWRAAGWVEALEKENKLILMDCRGHGKSGKPHDKAEYGKKMRDDVVGLMEHLSLTKANFFGYSMGAGLSLALLLDRPDLFRSLIMGGSVPRVEDSPTPVTSGNVIPDALLAETLDEVKDPVGRQFRVFAESTGADLAALAAVSLGMIREPVTKEVLKGITVPVMSVVGSNDVLIGNKAAVSELIPGGTHFQIEGKDHLSVVPDPKFKMVVRAFLNEVNRG